MPSASEPFDVVIVGAGHAGFHLAAALTGAGFGGSVLLLSDESVLPYERPPLSKSFLRADAVHGGAIGYRHLVLATGSHPHTTERESPDQRPHHPFARDALAVRAALVRAATFVVLGGVSIGLETASSARSRGLAVQVVELLPRLMARVVSDAVAELFLFEHRAMGTSVHLASSVGRIADEHGRAVSVETTEGLVIAADVIVAGVGALPRVELARTAGLTVTDAVVVNDQPLTADPDISPIGDCALFPVPARDEPARLDSVQNAVDQPASWQCA